MKLLGFLRLLLLSASLIAFESTHARAKELNIPPVAQQTAELCWAASAEMILSFYRFPNLNPIGNYQCAVVAAQGSPCNINCGLPVCLAGGGTTQRIAMVIRQYIAWEAQVRGFSVPSLTVGNVGILSPQEIVSSIDGGTPILAGISPQGIPFPPGLGFSQHAVVIIGYENTGHGFEIIFNDPYPYSGIAPYLQTGGRLLQLGRYQLPYSTFIQIFHYGNSITFG
jgi:Papain-like cysteine protease AvrRpt2